MLLKAENRHRALLSWLLFAAFGTAATNLSGQSPAYQFQRVRHPWGLGPATYDVARDRIVYVEGESTWEYDGASWARRGNGAPGGSRIDYDPQRRRVVAVRGAPGGPETWEYDGDAWRQLQPVSVPTYYGDMLYYPVLGRLLLLPFHPPTRNLWEWDGTNWTLSAIPAPPRNGPMVFDRARQRIVQYVWLGASAETWEWDGIAWQQLTPANIPVRGNSGLVYDAARQRTLLFGGRNPTNPGFSSELWEWDGATWTLRTAANQPPSRSEFVGMVFDEARQRVMVLGGTGAVGTWWFQLQDMWEWNGSSWTQRHSQFHPETYSSGVMCYDSARQKLLMVTVSRQTGTWEFAGEQWRLLTTGTPPTEALVFDSARGQVVSWGIGQLWEFGAANTWMQRQPALQPPNRSGIGLAYDAARARTVMFGGAVGQNLLADTWEWDGTSWLNVTPAQSPQPRSSPSMVDHPAMQGILMHGGAGIFNSPFDDTWIWNGTAWSTVPTVQRPTYRQFPGLAHDPLRNRTFLLGGWVGPPTQVTQLADVWELIPPNWVQVLPAGFVAGAMAFDSAAGHTVIYEPVGNTHTFGPHPRAQTASFGSGCPGSRGTPLLTSTEPYLGNANFVLELLDTLPAAPAAVALATQQGSLSLGGGCTLYLGGTVVPLFTVTGVRGTSALRLVIAPNPALRGLPMFAQAAILDPAGASGAAWTAGRHLVIGD